ITEELPGHRVAVLSGPNLAREIAAGKPASSVVASTDAELAMDLAVLIGPERFRIYTNPDLVGVELCGALKNVVALAAGMVDGLGFGDSAKAGIVTRGLAEMTRLGVAAGANPLTFSGLAGVGDLIATCMSPLSRNRRAGELLGSGMAWQDVAPRLLGIAEGVFTVRGALALGQRSLWRRLDPRMPKHRLWGLLLRGLVSIGFAHGSTAIRQRLRAQRSVRRPWRASGQRARSRRGRRACGSRDRRQPSGRV